MMRYYIVNNLIEIENIEIENIKNENIKCVICDNVFKDFKMDVCDCNLNICFNCVLDIYLKKSNYNCSICKKIFDYSEKSLDKNNFISHKLINDCIRELIDPDENQDNLQPRESLDSKELMKIVDKNIERRIYRFPNDPFIWM